MTFLLSLRKLDELRKICTDGTICGYFSFWKTTEVLEEEKTEIVAVLSTCYHDIPWINVTTFGYTNLFQLY
jgi:hypothetical protein